MCWFGNVVAECCNSCCKNSCSCRVFAVCTNKWQGHSVEVLQYICVLQFLASCLPTDRRVLAKIKELTKAGVHRATDMQPLIGDFVCNVLFAGQSEPPRYDSRFWPSISTIRRSIYAARVKYAKYVDFLSLCCLFLFGNAVMHLPFCTVDYMT